MRHLCLVGMELMRSLGTAQVAQSCKMLEMHADIKPAAGTADAYDFAIVGADEAIAALRCADSALTSR